MKKKYKIWIIIGIIILSFVISLFIVQPQIKIILPSTIIYDRNSIEIWEIINDKKTRHRFIAIDNIPEFTKKAIILMEDKTFFTNSGIDFFAIWRAIINNFSSHSKIEWASTISTQVIRNNYWLNEKRNYSKKMQEFYLSLSLNIHYSKKKILEMYLNNIYFWNLNYWIQSASKYYFNKTLKNLTQAEQIALIILPKNSQKYNPYTNISNFKKRFINITHYLFNNWLLNESEKISILNEKLIFNNNHNNNTLPYIVDFISKHKSTSPKSIHTTLDYYLTKKVNELAQNSIQKLAWKDVWDYGIIITDRNTNELQVMIGGIDYQWENGQVNATTALRQVGSTIKPFTYLLAFKDLWYQPETSILDIPVQYKTAEWHSYAPKNYSLDYKWEVSLAEALSQSINIPAVKLTHQIGIHRLYNFLKKLQISSLNHEPSYYWLALTLWVSEMSLFELLQAYSIFAHQWKFCNIIYKKNTTKTCTQIIENTYIKKVNFILTNRYFKLKGFPIHSNLDFSQRKVFVKTGTSRNFRDNWAVWFTKNYMIWVWVWNKGGTYMKGVSWATWAWEIFSKIVKKLEPVDSNSNKKAIIYKKNKNIPFLEITSPLHKSTYKIDHTKPQSLWKIQLQFETNIEYDTQKWFINNESIPSNFIEISPWISEIKIILYKNNKKIIEKISVIEVEE